MNVADVMNSCDDKAQRLGMNSLTEIERAIVLVNRANFEIECGSLTAFYYNSAGDHAVETVAALKRIGASEVANHLNLANTLFPKATPSKDRSDRFDQLEKVRTLDGDPLDRITTAIYACEPGMWPQLSRFIESNVDELLEHTKS